jgi:D-alanine-D-alanine ligase
LRWPLIVKPADQDASVGIDHESVVTTADLLRRRVRLMLERFGGTVLVEEYIAGREITVGVIETRRPGQEEATRRALPPSEYEFRLAENSWPIVTYSAKWQGTSDDDVEAPYHELAAVSPTLGAALSDLALRAFGHLGLRDYARIDFRVSPQEQPSILEANPNPDLGPAFGLDGALAAVGLTYSDLIAGLVEQALARGRRR